MVETGQFFVSIDVFVVPTAGSPKTIEAVSSQGGIVSAGAYRRISMQRRLPFAARALAQFCGQFPKLMRKIDRRASEIDG
jgi:hypothetical protein